MVTTILAMDPWVIWTFMAACVVLYLTPGADMMFTIASGMAGGPKAGVAANGGASVGILFHISLAAAGLAVLIAATPEALTAIKYAGAAYLLFLAWQSWTASGDAEPVSGRANVARAFKRGLLTNILNPKVGLFVLALLPQFTDPAAGPIWHQILFLGTLMAVGGFITVSPIGFFAGVFASRLRRAAPWLNKISAVIFGGLAARLVLD